MGFLNNSSSEYLVVDTILSKRGRELLSKGGQFFNIVKFTVDDSAIDYRLFNQSTGSVSQDSSILNTVVEEAVTNENIAIKYPCISISDPTLKFLPKMNSNLSSVPLNEMQDASVGKAVEFSQDTVLTGKRVPAEIVDGAFTIEMDNDLLAIDGQYPTGIYPDGRANYVLPRTAINSAGGAKITFNLLVRSLPTDIWDLHGIGTKGSRTISTQVSCIGVLSGLNKDISVTIQEGYTR